MDIAIERAEAPTAEIVELLAELDAALSGPYAADQRHALSIEQLFQPDVRFFVARLDGAAVACGGVGFYDGYAEVKRMYSKPSVRGRGVAKALLRRIEAEARAGGATLLRIETGALSAGGAAVLRRRRLPALRAVRPLREDAGARDRDQHFLREVRVGPDRAGIALGRIAASPRYEGTPARDRRMLCELAGRGLCVTGGRIGRRAMAVAASEPAVREGLSWPPFETPLSGVGTS